MKNNNLFLLVAAVFALISCGTANRSAQYSGTQFRNSIYYTPDSRDPQIYAQEQKYLQDLQERTSDATGKYAREHNYSTTSDTRNVYVGENNEVDIAYEPGVTYSIMDDQESYEARLRKFDSPYYTINIEFHDPYPWFDYRYGWYTPYGGRWYANWSHPWYSSYYSWYAPGWNWHWDWNWRWNWYHGPYWGWYDPFYDPWWGHAYWPGYWPGYHPGHWPGHHPGYHPGHGPGARPDHHRDIYYGKRNSSPTYRENGRGNVTATNGNAAGRPGTGSVTRRPANVTQINNSNRRPEMNADAGDRNQRPQNAVQNGGNNQYRRVVPGQGTKGNANVTSGNASKNNGSSYNRSNGSQTRSSYSRSSSSSQTRSTYSSGSSSQSRSSYSSGSSGSRSTGSSSSGSSYRRR